MKIWLTRFQFFLKIIGKMKSKLLILKDTGEYVELIHVADIDGEKSYLVEKSSGEKLSVTEEELGTRPLIQDKRLAVGVPVIVAALLAILSVLGSGVPIEDIVQQAQTWLGETNNIR